MNDKSLDAGRISALENALDWALDEIRILAAGQEPPDSPFWNEYRRSRVVLDGHEPDRKRA